MRTSTSLFLCLVWLVLPTGAYAHSLNDSYLELSVIEQSIEGVLQLAVTDLELAVGLDRNYDADITWGEIRQARADIDEYLLNRINLAIDDDACALSPGDYRVSQLPGGAYLVVDLSGHCPVSEGALVLAYSLMFDLDNSHRGVAAIHYQGSDTSHVFSPQRTVFSFDQADSVFFQTMVNFVGEGVWHIWIGIDHILFLVAMLLAVVVHRRADSAIASADLGVELLKLVTAFTVAHSITLVLATLELITLPVAVVESAIAFTVVASGVNVMYPLFGKRHWQFAFGFGLIHGFGFANVLAEIELSSTLFLSSLLGFNLGVELGQLAILLVLVPVLLLITNRNSIRRLAAPVSGLIICQLGLFWLVERSL